MDNNAKIKNVKIGKKFIVLSGKGGVGKSTFAVNLSVFLAKKGYKVGLLDVDIHGPSVPGLLGIENERIYTENNKIIPYKYMTNLKVMTVGFMLEKNDQAVVWRGPLKFNVIKQFIEDVKWGELDYLVVDCPPGTGDEPLSIVQLLEDNIEGIIVTTPQKVSTRDVEKCITFCNMLNLRIAGIIENMSGFICPHCEKRIDIFKSDGGKELSKQYNVPFLGAIPMSIDVVESGDNGVPIVNGDSSICEYFNEIITKLIKIGNENNSEKNITKFAIPSLDGEDKLNSHFGGSDGFFIIEADNNGNIISKKYHKAPEHKPGAFPKMLISLGIDCIIVGDMGERAKSIFEHNGIKIVKGAPEEKVDDIVKKYIEGKLELTNVVCHHHEDDDEHHHHHEH